jgi:hypothetical protein
MDVFGKGVGVVNLRRPGLWGLVEATKLRWISGNSKWEFSDLRLVHFSQLHCIVLARIPSSSVGISLSRYMRWSCCQHSMLSLCFSGSIIYPAVSMFPSGLQPVAVGGRFMIFHPLAEKLQQYPKV